MSLLRATLERRVNLEDPTVPISSPNLLEWLGGTATASGKTVSVPGAMALTAVYRAMALLAGTGASLPLKLYNSRREERGLKLFDRPHPDLTLFEIVELWIEHLAGWGNSYTIKRRDGSNRVVELWPIQPDRVTVTRDYPTAGNPSGKIFTVSTAGRDGTGRLIAGGQPVQLTSADILHIPGFGYDGVVGLSPVGLAREAIAAGLSAEEYASRLWANGALVSGVLQTKQKLDRAQAEALQQRINEKMTGLDRAHSVAVLDAGAEFHPISIPPQDAQFLDTRRFQVAEVARLYGIPPHLLGETDRTTSWGTGIEQQTTGFIVYTLQPGYLRRIEARVTKELAPAGQKAEFSVQGLLRGDHRTRASFYQTMHTIGALTTEEIRDLENYPAREETPAPEPEPALEPDLLPEGEPEGEEEE